MTKTQSEENTEVKILEAARKVFERMGYYGARMQDIADEAQINKAMLHYYYRSKEKLFERILDDAIKSVLGIISQILNIEMSLEDKIRFFIKTYIEFIQNNQFVPGFVIHELSINSESAAKVLNSFKALEITPFFKQINEEIAKGNIVNIHPAHIILNLMSWCIFPFLSKNLIMSKAGINDEQFNLLIEERKTILPELFINSIKVHKS